MSVAGDQSDGEYSVIGDRGEVGFIDFEDDRSVCSYNPDEEGPVIISVPFPFVDKKPQSVSIDETAAESITIKNTTSDCVELWGIQIYASNPEESFAVSLIEPSKPGFVSSSSIEDRVLQPHKSLTVWLSCKPKDIGLHTCIVHFDVGDEKIERVVFLLAEDNISKALSSKKPYQKQRRRGNFVVDSYVNGVRPARASNHTFRNRLPMYNIPKDIREQLQNKQVPDALVGGLSRKNYVAYFKTLLIMEELRLEEDIRAYDMENATMKNRGRQFLILVVLGLAERRPSLVHGDSVYARLASPDGVISPVYEGCVHHVEADQVCLKFADDFHHRHRDKNLYNIRFMYNRVNMRRLYQAIKAAEKLHTDFLFPTESALRKQITPSTIVPASATLNEEQLNAVKMILGCKGGVPYVINGPPGTGKTRTLVEVVLQLYNTRKNSHILVCASSNSAADHILQKLLDQKEIKLQENEIFRLNASSRPYEDMKPDYLRFCFFEECLFRCPPLKALLHYRIIVTTYMSAAVLHAEGVKKGNFSHIILDEAGQASEPETMVPVSNLCHEDTVIVLAGDPMQLGPVIFSPVAKRFGLGKSYLERLFECELYSEGGEGYVTTLLRNYRSHPEILQLPSELFYRGELVACYEPVKPAPWEDLLPNKEFPILFTGVQAYDEREGDNPSWFNRTEASMVVKLIKKLIARNVDENTIGVITPYRQQVAKIKKALEDADILDIKIGSVEQFQGQERDVIITSTVRSTIKHDEFDRVHTLGFLSNPKRFNVTITRARSLLVIIGNPHIICKDPFWEKLLWRCVENNSYEGCSLPEKRCYDYNTATEQQWPYSEMQETVHGFAGQEAPGRWSGVVEQEGQGGWSNGSEQNDQSGWADAVEKHTQGEWSGVVEQDIQGGWSNASEHNGQSGWAVAVEKCTQGEWSGKAEQGGPWGWSDDVVEQRVDGGWSDGVEQVEKSGWSDGVEQVEKSGWSDGVEQVEKSRWSDAEEQGTQRARSDSTERRGNGTLAASMDKRIQAGQSNAVKQGTQDLWSHNSGQTSGDKAATEAHSKQEFGWDDDFSQPVKDEDQWSDGWK